MARWDPGTEQRLRKAALELYRQHGYDAVTVTQIAERAGITRRSYFRYFPDKREVLFANSDQLPPAIAKAVLVAADHTPPLTAVLDALTEVGNLLAVDVEQLAERRDVIASSPELQERERTKAATVSVAIQQALEQRGTATGTSKAIAQVATIAFANAFQLWIEAKANKPFRDCLTTATTELRTALADPSPA
ncbi:TetR family transcriptional regulator [Kribbella voronezhensis]|uniref:TetR family transcriptional regulator n=1 Tax=Kribbella voronezhensis TaxID=2512212 RepID=A0A4R7THX2_9ACTN|nr:TetR/AcrR family transcriptional regulator [Kribbella voronezhensis]TDU91931.1 TetR family transcriptional regulator [Kribbella voronezhensis]